jgi:hypothetical protein
MTQFDNLRVYVNGSFAGKGCYFEWLQNYINVREIVCWYTSLEVWEDENSTEFILRADDSTQAAFVWKQNKLWLISPFVDDDEQYEIEPKEFNRRLKEFASEYQIKNVIYRAE